MSALAKEKIFVELREYHTHHFPTKVKNQVVSNLIAEFEILEDKFISMILSLASGKLEFVDTTEELNKFQERLDKTVPDNGSDGVSKDLFTSKINKLLEISNFAKATGFQLRRVKAPKVKQ